MTRTSTNTWTHKGWGIEYFGTGYKMTRLTMVNEEFPTMTAPSIAKARMLIDRAEMEIKAVGHIVKGRR